MSRDVGPYLTDGEAVKHVPDDVRDKDPGIKWRKIAGLRDIVAHEYFGISDELIWDIVENEIPSLRKSISALIKTL